MYAKLLGLYAHVTCWLCELYLECGQLNFLFIYVKYMYSAPCCLFDASDFIYIYIIYIYTVEELFQLEIYLEDGLEIVSPVLLTMGEETSQQPLGHIMVFCKS